jgi:hypothetical protein
MCARSPICVSPGMCQAAVTFTATRSACRMHEEDKKQELLLCWLNCNTKLQSPCRCLTPPSVLYRRVVETSSVSGVSFPVLGVGKQFTKTVFCYVENWTQGKIAEALQWLIYGLDDLGSTQPRVQSYWGRFLRR